MGDKMSNLSFTDFTPTVEYSRAVCTCGKELSTAFYQLTAKAHFERFAADKEVLETEIENMGFGDHTQLQAKAHSLGFGFCCIMNMRYGIREPVAIIPPTDQDARKYPEGLPGPLSKEKTLSWY
jgi:hypothetical protein